MDDTGLPKVRHMTVAGLLATCQQLASVMQQPGRKMDAAILGNQ